MRTENRVVLASPELRMAPLGSDNLDPNADLRTRQYTLNQEKSGLDFGVHYTLCTPVLSDTSSFSWTHKRDAWCILRL